MTLTSLGNTWLRGGGIFFAGGGMTRLFLFSAVYCSEKALPEDVTNRISVFIHGLVKVYFHKKVEDLKCLRQLTGPGTVGHSFLRGGVVSSALGRLL